MHVYLVASQVNLSERIEQLRRLIKAIHNEGHILSRDWIEPAYATENSRKPTEWLSVYQESIDAIIRSDVVIAEANTPSLGVGYQIAVATQSKKPILILRHEDLDDDFFLSGIRATNVVYRKYNDETVEETVTGFLRENDIPAKDMRFNFFIDRQIYNYLRWSSLRNNKTKAEILRELVLKEINKEDA